MKIALALLCIAAAFTTVATQGIKAAPASTDTTNLFTMFVQLNSKTYGSVNEFYYRARVFQQNLSYVLGGKLSNFLERVSIEKVDGETVIKINRTGNACDFEMSLNKFFDMSDEEFKSYYLLPEKFFDEKIYQPVSKIVTEQNGEKVITEMNPDADLFDEVHKLNLTDKAQGGVKATDGSEKPAIGELRDCLNSMKSKREDKPVSKPADQGLTKSCQQVIKIGKTIKRAGNTEQPYTQTVNINTSAVGGFLQQFTERRLQTSLSFAPKYLAQNFDSYASIGTTQVPMFLDWNQISPLTPVKDQKKCNSCYVFSATSSLEAHNGILNNDSNVMADQEIIDCSTENEGCVGGQPYLVYDYIINNGISYNSAYPYAAAVGTCRASRISSYQKFSGLRGYVFPKPGVLNLIKALQYGPVVIIMYASNDLKYYYDGIFEGQGCTGTETPNHSALVYGYNLDADKPYFMLKNNWGTGWGDAGHYKIAIGPLTSSNTGYCLMAQTRYNVLPVLKR